MSVDKKEYPYGCTTIREKDLEKEYIFQLCDLVKKDIKSSKNIEDELDRFFKAAKAAKDSNVWALLGGVDNNNSWICLQVGSAGNIVPEIKSAITCMLSLRGDKEWYGYFNKEMSLFKANYGLDVACQKYESMYKRFDVFKFILIDHEQYLSSCQIDHKDKIRYAETKFAHYSKALYWNPCGIEYSYLMELENQQN